MSALKTSKFAGFPNNIAEALTRVHAALKKRGGSHILHFSQISRSDRELLMKMQWLEEIMRGWYLLTRPDVAKGDTTPWYASFWDFIKAYLEFHHDKDYCLSAECSIDIHLGDLTVPKQLVVIGKKGSGVPLKLPHGTSLLVYSDPTRLPEERQEVIGLQVMSLPYALCRVNPNYFVHSPMKAESALRSVNDVSTLLDIIISSNLKSVAERLIGAYRFLKLERTARDLQEGLLAAGIIAKEVNPFDSAAPLIHSAKMKAPHALRIQTMWAAFRPVVIDNFRKAIRVVKNASDYLDDVQGLYIRDAYNSLSIEGYKVTEELIMKVQAGAWLPDKNTQDSEQMNALAARGYFETFEEVKKSIMKIFKGEEPGKVVRDDLPLWFQKLFAPNVRAGLLRASDLYGWRRHQVYIRGSRHTPLGTQYLMDAMEAFFYCLEEEEDPRVRAILGHFIFVYIHPYMDGNGRIARFLMNTQLASGGFPWVVVPVEKRAQYFSALESASVEGDIVPFTKFINALVK